MTETTNNGWTIIGDNELARVLRRASGFVPASSPVTISTAATNDPIAFVLGPAVLESQTENVVPYYSAFEAIEFLREEVVSGRAGRIYGCFTHFRVPRDTATDALPLVALLPAMAVALDCVPGEIRRVWATRASLFAENDAWFVTIRLEDDTLLTVEAAAMGPADSPRDLLVEVTASERVLRAEPTRQAIVIEPVDGPTRSEPWWEDLAERYLHLVTKRSATAGRNPGTAGSRLRRAWTAAMQSAQNGLPVTLD